MSSELARKYRPKWLRPGTGEQYEPLNAADGGKEQNVGRKKAMNSGQGTVDSEDDAGTRRRGDAEKKTVEETVNIGRFNPAEPWPEGTRIILNDGRKLDVTEIDLETSSMVLRLHPRPTDGTPPVLMTFDMWNDQDAGKVDEIIYPDVKPPVAEEDEEVAGSWEPGAGEDEEEAEEPSAKPGRYKPLEWRDGTADDGNRVVACAAACITADDLTLEFRVSVKGSRYWLDQSSGELVGPDSPVAGPYPTIEAAKAGAERTNHEAWESAREEIAAAADAEPINQSTDQPINPPPAAPSHLPIPRPSDVDVSLIDVISNVRSEESLSDEDYTDLGESIAQQGQIEAVKLMRLPNGRYQMLEGERRLRAAKKVGLASLRAEVYDQPLDASQILWFQLMTFCSRKDLTHAERAAGLQQYAQRTGMTGAAVAKALKISDDVVRKHFAYLTWREKLRDMVDEGKLSMNKAITIARLPEDKQDAMADRTWLHALSESQVTYEVNAAMAGPAGGLLPIAADGGASEISNLKSPATPSGVCRCCGCTEDKACGDGCGWCDESKTLCTVCGDEDGEGQALSALVHLGLDADIPEKLAAAGIDTIGDLAELTRRRGTFWWRDLENLHGFGEAACGKLDDALAKFHFAREWKAAPADLKSQISDSDGQGPSDGPTDEHDRVNPRTQARVNEAPIKGTKADTAADRHAQAKRDSDAADPGPIRREASASGPNIPPTKVSILLDGTVEVIGGVPCFCGRVTYRGGGAGTGIKAHAFDWEGEDIPYTDESLWTLEAFAAAEQRDKKKAEKSAKKSSNGVTDKPAPKRVILNAEEIPTLAKYDDVSKYYIGSKVGIYTGAHKPPVEIKHVLKHNGQMMVVTLIAYGEGTPSGPSVAEGHFLVPEKYYAGPAANGVDYRGVVITHKGKRLVLDGEFRINFPDATEDSDTEGDEGETEDGEE